MLMSQLASCILLSTNTDGRTLLHGTENEEPMDKFDCVYFMPNHKDEIPYCPRPDRNQCDNQGEKNHLEGKGVDVS